MMPFAVQNNAGHCTVLSKSNLVWNQLQAFLENVYCLNTMSYTTKKIKSDLEYLVSNQLQACLDKIVLVQYYDL